ncbi:gamma-soluble NSF attachment protein isoform X3 [Lagenorhynchus albirostris]|uniref:gamma-soluble NSF attachment protein isoform X3 n=1 Tax=Lagenorhynchus albirostris TaxID=27610 RepID=UPI0028E3ADED|nr:gamma-soluble NSF attachment protein isoform X3 [Lagenorhynchus albirostris]
MAAQKINEGLEHLAKAEKCLKTGFLKWKPDYDSAASEYGKAAVAFKNAKQFEQAKDACLREAVAHENNRALFHAAKAYEQAGMMLKEMQKLPEAVQLIEKASMMYLENGTPDTAAMALERAGKLIENVDPEKAVQLYQQTANVFENEERLRQAVELLGKASRLLVRGRRFDEAALSIQKEKNIYKEIENYPTCYKLSPGRGVAAGTVVQADETLSAPVGGAGKMSSESQEKSPERRAGSGPSPPPPVRARVRVCVCVCVWLCVWL